MYLLRGVDPTFASLLLAPFILAIAAWALRVACSLSSVDPPEYLQSTLTVILIGTANAVLYFFFQYAQVSPGLGTRFIAHLLTTATVIAITVRTGPLSAVVTTISFASLCGVVCYSLMFINAAVVAKFFA